MKNGTCEGSAAAIRLLSTTELSHLRASFALVPALPRRPLTLIVAAEIGAAVRPPGGAIERHERQLGDQQPGIQLDRHPGQVVELQRQRPLPTGIAEARGGVDDQAKAPQ